VLADSPRAYWRLGETSGATAVDQLGVAPGTYTGGVVLGAVGALTGDPNTAARFDGSDDRVIMGDPANGSLDFGTGDFTAEAWVKTAVNGERAIASKRLTSTGAYWQFTVTDDPGRTGTIRVNISDGSVIRELYGPARRVDDGAWHHVVVVFDRDVGVTVYVDGISLATPAPATGDVSNTGPFLVGKSTGYGYFNGDIDEVAVYPAVLPAARVQAHRLAGIG
jgi:Concanavalin A-like lectin/glucanases superfamily